MNTWKAILAVLIIFGAGLVTGVVLNKVSVSAKPAITPAAKPPAASGPRTQKLALEQLRKVELMMLVQKELNLTPEQRERIEKVIGDGQERIRDLWDQVAPEIYDEYEDVKKKLCEELTPEQKKLFDELMKQQQRKPKPASTNAPPQTVTQ